MSEGGKDSVTAYSKILAFYDKVSSVSSFKLVFSLLMASEKSEVRAHAEECAEVLLVAAESAAAGESNKAMIHRVCQAFV